MIGSRHGARRLPIAPLMPDLAGPFQTVKPLRYFHSNSGASRSVGFFLNHLEKVIKPDKELW